MPQSGVGSMQGSNEDCLLMKGHTQGGGPEVEKIILFLCKFSAKNRDYCDFSKGVKGNPKSNIIVCVQT